MPYYNQNQVSVIDLLPDLTSFVKSGQVVTASQCPQAVRLKLAPTAAKPMRLRRVAQCGPECSTSGRLPSFFSLFGVKGRVDR